MSGGYPTHKQCARVNSFVKSEAYTEYKCARMINSRTDFFKVFCGPAIKALENVVYQFNPFVKHVPVKDRWKKIESLRRNYKYYYETDYSSFEASMTPDIMSAVEMVVYERAFATTWAKGFDIFRRTLLGVNKCVTRTGLRCNIRGRRMSGEMCTSLGNGLTNYMVLSYLMSLAGFEDKFDCLIEGDDGLIGSNVALDANMFKDLGFNIKIQRVDSPEKANFCGLTFARDGECIRDPIRFLVKFGWTNTAIAGTRKTLLKLLLSKCLSTLYETPDCPIVSTLAYSLYEKLKFYKPTWVVDYHNQQLIEEIKSTKYKPRQPQPYSETRDLFEEMFHITVEEQLFYEARILEGDYAVLAGLHFHPDVLDYASKFVV